MIRCRMHPLMPDKEDGLGHGCSAIHHTYVASSGALTWMHLGKASLLQRVQPVLLRQKSKER